MGLKATSIGGSRRAGRGGGSTPAKLVNNQLNVISNPPVLPPPEDPQEPPPKLKGARAVAPLPVIRAWKELTAPGQAIPPGQIIRLIVKAGRARF